jgi:hypothetical protein
VMVVHMDLQHPVKSVKRTVWTQLMFLHTVRLKTVTFNKPLSGKTTSLLRYDHH